MYKVLLVDDEALIREAISENIKWEELGYELIGACKDGREAIEVMKDHSPHLLLTDIFMPYVDGIELSRYVYENCPETKVIIISGYDEFEYAKKAVKYQVLEYILKPITAFELSETLLRVRGILEEEENKKNSIKKIRGAYVSNLPLLRGRFLNNLVQGTGFMEDIQEKFEELKITLKGRVYAVALVEGDEFLDFLKNYPDIKNDLALFAIYNITEEIVGDFKCGVTFQNAEDKTVVIFAGENEAELTETIDLVCRKVKQSIYEYLQIETTTCIGRTVSSVNKLNVSFEGARSAIEYRFLLGGNQIFYARDFENNEGNETAESLDVSKITGQIILSIKTNNIEELEQDIKRFMESIREAYVPKNRIIIYIQNLILSIMNAVDSIGVNEESIFEEERNLLNNLYLKKNLKEIEVEVLEFCRNIAGFMSSERDSFCKKQAILAKDYIEKNYANQDISLNSVCNYLAMSTSYFSSVFKNYTGETFIEALTKTRIEKAKNLIENTKMKSYEIAESVGFSDPHYFSITFKKITGKTPTEYAKGNRKL